MTLTIIINKMLKAHKAIGKSCKIFRIIYLIGLFITLCMKQFVSNKYLFLR